MKRFITVFIAFSLYFNSFTLAHASGLNGWTLQNPIVKGASVAYEGAKNVIINGKNVAKTSTALITPTASQVAKLLGKGVAGVALSVAVEELLGMVDWVLDPANNQVVYYEKANLNCLYISYVPNVGLDKSSACGLSAAMQKGLTDYNSRKGIKDVQVYSLNSCTASSTRPESGTCQITITTVKTGETRITIWSVSTILNPDYTEEDLREKKTLNLEVVAQKVISNAESGDKNAQVATTAAAADIVNDAQKDDAKARPIVNQLEANSKTETDADANTATGETKPNTETGGTDLALEFPTFCGWAPQVCEAAQVVINFPTTLTDWWNTSNQKADSWAKSISDAYVLTKEWFQKEPELKDEPLEIQDQNITDYARKDYVTFGASCPFSPNQVSLPLGVLGELSFESDLTFICTFGNEARPFVIGLGYLGGLIFLLIGLRNGNG